MQNCIAEMCEKITAQKITSYRCPSEALHVYVCLLQIEAKKKANRCFVQTKRPCRSLFNFVPHCLYVFFLQFSQKRLLMYLLLYLSSIIKYF